jgi:hypothetical protein
MFCLISFSALSQTVSSDTLSVVVKTKFGELTFRKFCQENKFEFQQTKNPIFDKDVELEARQKQILKDTLEVQFSIDKSGKVVAFDITKKSSLGKLNTFILDLFNDAILKMHNQTYSLTCNNIESVHTMPLIYERQKSK